MRSWCTGKDGLITQEVMAPLRYFGHFLCCYYCDVMLMPSRHDDVISLPVH